MTTAESLLAALQVTLRHGVYLFAFPLFISVMIYSSERLVTGWFIRTTGYRGLWITAWLGTPVHESAHAIMCFLFRCPVKEIRFFIPDPESQVLGYVKYTHNPKNPFHWLGRWFIGLAPLLAGSAFLLGLVTLTGFFRTQIQNGVPHAPASDWISVLELHTQTFSQTGKEILAHFSSGGFYQEPVNLVILYISLAVVTHMAPSYADLKSTLPGWFFMFFLALGGNLFVVYLGVSVSVDHFFTFISLLMTRLLSVALCLSLFNLIFWFFVLNVIHRLKTGFWLMGKRHNG